MNKTKGRPISEVLHDYDECQVQKQHQLLKRYSMNLLKVPTAAATTTTSTTTAELCGGTMFRNNIRFTMTSADDNFHEKIGSNDRNSLIGSQNFIRVKHLIPGGENRNSTKERPKSDCNVSVPCNLANAISISNRSTSFSFGCNLFDCWNANGDTDSEYLFGVPLRVVEKYQDTHVPILVVACIDALHVKGLLTTEGLYRASPSKIELTKVIKKIDKGFFTHLNDINDGILIGAVLKAYFVALPTHLVSITLFDKFFRDEYDMNRTKDVESKWIHKQLKAMIQMLENDEHDTLQYLVMHLRGIAANSAANGMPAHSIAIIWGPVIFSSTFRSNEMCLKSMNLLEIQLKATEMLVVHYNKFFDVPTNAEGFPFRCLQKTAHS